MAKYKTVADALRKQITRGDYPKGGQLPNQNELAEKFVTSRVTIKKALDLLSIEGLVFSIQGSGTYVKKNIRQLSETGIKIGQNIGLTHQIGEQTELVNKVLAFNVRFPRDEECKYLMIKKESPVYEIKRLRVINNKPYSVEYSLLPVELVPNITLGILEHSVYDYIRQDVGLIFGGNQQFIKAAPPNDEDRQYLSCKDNEPVLEVTKIMFLENGRPFEYSKVRHRYDMVEMCFNDTQHE
ncbi:GntR family transcriptional regulator [Carnobacterium jeotgali]|uniref:GntR family transcriptional regulator n=1 Tax=Carnobacterium jeotgali TaxID=545534 RepID=UPI000493B0A7|nr:GntR family transcriptional regulator [Carnobacterium jeotgali]